MDSAVKLSAATLKVIVFKLKNAAKRRFDKILLRGFIFEIARGRFSAQHFRYKKTE